MIMADCDMIGSRVAIPGEKPTATQTATERAPPVEAISERHIPRDRD